MKILQVSKEGYNRETISSNLFDKWVDENRHRSLHKTIYEFKSPSFLVHPSYAIVNKIVIDVDNYKNNPDRILNKFFDEEDIKRSFVASGNNFHLYLDMKQIEPRYAKNSIYDYLSYVEMMTGVEMDINVSIDLVHMIRVPGSINEKNNNKVVYYNPSNYKVSLNPIYIGNNVLEIDINDTKPKPLSNYNNSYVRDRNVDPTSLGINIPKDQGHYSRINIFRKLKNKGVNKEDALEYMKEWLSEDKYYHFLNEKVPKWMYPDK